MQALIFAAAWQGGQTWWVGPTYPLSYAAWREMRIRARKVHAEIHEGDRRIDFPTGGWIEVHSADRPDSLRSVGLDYLVVDEAAFCSERAWLEALRPTLTDRRGKAILGSTPNGKNRFWHMWGTAGRSRRSWQYPTADNPSIHPDEIRDAREELPERVFQQEYEAAFRDLAGAVFRHVRDQSTATPQKAAVAGHTYVLGIDWARSNDFTAVIVIDVDLMAVVFVDKWTGIEYAAQMGRVGAIAERFAPAAIVSEVNNMGGPLSDALRDAGLPIVPFTSTNATKLQIVDGLSLALEREAITLIPHEALTAELEAYESTRLPSGLIRYAAPEGTHDDLTMATMLALWGASSAALDYSATLM